MLLSAPYVIVDHLGGIQYADFRERTLPRLLDYIPFSFCKEM
jgi:hypothetical protein